MEQIQSVSFTITIVTDMQTVTRTGTSFRELADSLDDLYDQARCPFPADMDEEDPEWWDYDDETEEVPERAPRDRGNSHFSYER